MKKLMIGVLTAVTIMGMSTQVFAADSYRHKSNPADIIGEDIPISNYAPKDVDINKVAICGKNIEIGRDGVLIYKGKIMVPLKFTAESLGFTVEADKDNKIISLDNGKIKTKVYVGEDSYYYSSSNAIGLTMMHPLGAEPIIDDNMVYVPINFYNFLFNDAKTVGSFFVRNKDGQWIYSVNGELTTGWKLINDKWYFMNNNGIMQRGWVKASGNWYYLLSNGEMGVNITTPDGYKVDQSGKWDGKPAVTVTQNPDADDIINPIDRFDTIDQAQKALKFKVNVPKELLGKYNIKYINTISRDLFQICYISKQGDILFRMAEGIQDISGDYNNYKTNTTVNINGSNIKLKGENNIIKVATWSVNNMSYSISIDAGMNQDDIIKIIKSTF
ncbi:MULTISPECIES: stalk domain-containing protein [unclassified Clostridium]|uniref:stalk domain-containing protein n=1 Tax=unclassified Clostridium TaxID=2614128 RepID=UPI000297F542|nr:MULTISPECIES: stalk domain-containing protein [unclassified Clostridium]EKQ54558.1 MAG: copper amine oxidase family protein,putative cell wall binding protein [Clostridium sp. Maddingley MBC34-26]